MPKGPLGGPRPAARCDQELDIFFNPTKLSEDQKDSIVNAIRNPAENRIITSKFEEDFNISIKEMSVFRDETRIIIKTREASMRIDVMESIESFFGSMLGTRPDSLITHAR